MKFSVCLCAALGAALLLSGCGGMPSGNPPQARIVPSASEPEPPAPSVSAPAASSAVPGPDVSGPDGPEPDAPGPDASGPDASGPGPDRSAPEPPGGDGEPVSDPEQLLALAEEADWSAFDDVVMIGDSVSLKLKNFVVQQRKTEPGFFGTAQFLTSGSLGSGNALWEVSSQSVHPAFQGTKMPLDQSVPLTGAKTAYLMLGVNDVAVYGVEGSVENYQTLLDSIQAAVPDIRFCVQSATPICRGAEVGALNNETLVRYNEKLAEMCESRGIRFLDVASVLRDEEGFLPREYCSDPDGMGIHLTDKACRLWLGFLLADAQNS